MKHFILLSLLLCVSQPFSLICMEQLQNQLNQDSSSEKESSDEENPLPPNLEIIDNFIKDTTLIHDNPSFNPIKETFQVMWPKLKLIYKINGKVFTETVFQIGHHLEKDDNGPICTLSFPEKLQSAMNNANPTNAVSFANLSENDLDICISTLKTYIEKLSYFASKKQNLSEEKLNSIREMILALSCNTFIKDVLQSDQFNQHYLFKQKIRQASPFHGKISEIVEYFVSIRDDCPKTKIFDIEWPLQTIVQEALHQAEDEKKSLKRRKGTEKGEPLIDGNFRLVLNGQSFDMPKDLAAQVTINKKNPEEVQIDLTKLQHKLKELSRPQRWYQKHAKKTLAIVGIGCVLAGAVLRPFFEKLGSWFFI